MAIFNKRNDQNGSTATTIIAYGAKLKGEFTFESILHLDGHMSGIVRSNNAVVIGKDGRLDGELSAQKVIVGGHFEGEIECDSLEILASGAVIGNINVSELSIENGGRFEGKSSIRENQILHLNQDYESNSDNAS